MMKYGKNAPLSKSVVEKLQKGFYATGVFMTPKQRNAQKAQD
jgi:hypothetical protein